MKLRISTIISLVGVLGAGSAAALVNTQVLQNTEKNSSGTVAVASEGSNTTDSTDTTVTGAEVTKINAEVTKINSNVLTSTQAMYQIGDAGVVTLDTAGNLLTIVSASPNSGWTVVKAENDSPTSIEVKLQSADTLIEFRASIENGEIVTSVESKYIGSTGDGGTTPGSGTTPSVGSVDDHGDDDEHEDEGHEVEDHEEDDD